MRDFINDILTDKQKKSKYFCQNNQRTLLVFL